MGYSKIICISKPFDLRQKLYVYEDGNNIETVEPKMNDLYSTIFALTEKYNIKNIELIGSKRYNEGLRKKLQEDELKRYNKNELEVNVQ